MLQLRPYQQDLLQQVQNVLVADAKAKAMMQFAHRRRQNHYRRGAIGRLAYGWAQGDLADAPQGIGLSNPQYADRCPRFGNG